MSSITNGWLALVALLAILTFALVLAVFVMMIVNLIKVNGIARWTARVASQVDTASTSASATSKVIQGLKSENASLQSKLQLEQSARQTAASRVAAAEDAAESVASLTRDHIDQRVEKARTKEFAELQEKMRGVEMHNLALHQECADLRAQLAKTGKRAVANNVDLNETEQLLEKTSRRLVTVEEERNAAQREITVFKLEIEKLKAEISTLLARPAAAAPHVVPEAPVAVKESPASLKASTAEPIVQPKSKPKTAPTTEPKPAIITRTTSATTSGVSEFDDADKSWTADEDSELLTAYLASRNLAATAESIRVDQRQVALRLVSLLLGPHGVIDDPLAPNHGKTYSAADSKAIIQAWRDGRKLPAIARDFQRDQLGIGWKLLDDRTKPVELTLGMIPDIVEEMHR